MVRSLVDHSMVDAQPHAASTARRASSAWMVTAVLCLLAASALAVGAVAYQIRETRPQGEGELFFEEAAAARRMLEEAESQGQTPDEAIRHVRNRLAVEMVAVIDVQGTYVASTSPNWLGLPVEPPLLRGMLSDARFGAVTAALSEPILIDGVVEWAPGDALYQVAQPLHGASGLLLSYDVSGLLARRAAQQGVRPLTLMLAAGGVGLLIAAILLLVARDRARHRLADAAREAERMDAHSRELQRHNVELEEARDQAERALALAEETNRIRSEFVLMINHELRTPLTSVVTGAELLLEDDLGEGEARQVLADMAQDGRRLQELISRMLTVARIENRGLGYTMREVPLRTVLERVGTLGSNRMLDEIDRLRVERPQTVLHTDPDPLSHLLVSLCDNALTHGAAHVRIEITARLPFTPMAQVGEIPEEGLIFLVIDDGPGIDPEFLSHMFEKFERRGDGTGTGLGLYIARLTVEAIDAAIAVTTGPGGTTMAVAVPVVPSRVGAGIPA